MEIYGMEVEYIGDYKSYKVYAPTTHAFIGKILFIEKQGEFELCDPFTYDDVCRYLYEHNPHFRADEDYEDEEDLQEDSSK